MLDIGFFELVVIAVVALLVVGPQRLPRLARTAGLWFGKARRFIGSVQSEVEKELKADELRRIMEEQQKSAGVHQILEETEQAFHDFKSDVERPASGAAPAAAEPAATRPQTTPPDVTASTPSATAAPQKPVAPQTAAAPAAAAPANTPLAKGDSRDG